MDKKECLKIMTRCIAFVVVFSMLFGNATDLLMRHDDESNEIHAFYSEPKDTIDVLYVGSSPLLRGVSPMVMWDLSPYSKSDSILQHRPVFVK